MSCHVVSRHVMSCHGISRLVISCHHVMSSIMAAGWPRRGFRNRGPVRESGSERRSRCGAACTASVRVWRRAHFCRVRVAGCGDRACLRHVAGVSRRCAVGIGFRARFVHAWSTCLSRGRLRGSCVLGGVSRACPWGWGSGRVAHAHDFTRCDLRFAWQVWDFGCIDALGKALDGGSAWQAQ